MDPNAAETPTSGGAGRRQTEKRKVQNREAQRKYRQKIKSRLETLEREAAQKAQDGGNSRTESNHIQTSNPFPADNSLSTASILDDSLIDISEMDGLDLVSSTGLGLGSNNDFYSMANSHSDMFLDPLSNDMAWSSEFIPQKYLGSSPWANPFEYPATLADTPYFNNISQPISTALPIEWPASHTSSFQAPATLGGTNAAVTTPTQPIQKLQIEASAKSPLQEHRTPTTIKGDIDMEIMHHLRLANTKEHQSLIKTAIARGHNIRDVLLAGLGALSNPNPNPAPERPRTPSLNLTRVSTLQAFLAIAKAMDLSMDLLHDEDSVSPFYQGADPRGKSKAKGKGFIDGSQKLMPPSLRPVRAQIMHAHHPCWDLIPFPSFRQRILSLQTLKPPPFDVYELKNDIFMNDGITCWRAGNRGKGQPWDFRSWEAEKWFSEKYSFLIAEDCELRLQTRWWRVIRGEKPE